MSELVIFDAIDAWDRLSTNDQQFLLDGHDRLFPADPREGPRKRVAARLAWCRRIASQEMAIRADRLETEA